MIIKRKYTLNILFFLIPFSLTISTLAAEILSIIFLLIFSLSAIKKNFKFKFEKKIIYFLVIFHMYVFYSASQNSYDDLMIKGMGYIRFLLLYFLLMLYLQNRNVYDSNKIIKLYLGLFYLVLIDAIIQFFLGYNILGFEIESGRVTGIFKDEAILGSFILRFLPIILWIMVFNNFDFKENKFFYFILFSLSFVGISISAGRSSFFLMMIFIILAMVLLNDLKKIILTSASFVAVLIFFISVLNIGKTDLQNRIILKTFNQVTDHKYHDKKFQIKRNESETYKIYIYNEDYHNNYKLAFNLFKKNLITGLGVRGFRSYCRDINYDSEIGYCSTHPHNILLQIASELGLIGISFYLVALIYFLKKFLFILKNKNILIKKKSNLLAISTIAIFINFFPLAPSANFFSGWSSYFYYFTLALFIFSISINTKSDYKAS